MGILCHRERAGSLLLAEGCTQQSLYSLIVVFVLDASVHQHLVSVGHDRATKKVPHEVRMAAMGGSQVRSHDTDNREPVLWHLLPFPVLGEVIQCL